MTARSSTRSFTYTQEVIATINPDCDVSIDTSGDVSIVSGRIVTELNSAANGEEVLFTIVVKAKNADRLRDVLSLNNQVTRTEAYSNQNEIQNMALHFDSNDEGFSLYQNTPNPYKGETIIGFKLPQGTSATMTIYDITGRLIKCIESEYEAGYNEVPVRSTELGTTGVLYYQLDTDEYTATKKMIVISD